jgi:hypothetical protein
MTVEQTAATPNPKANAGFSDTTSAETPLSAPVVMAKPDPPDGAEDKSIPVAGIHEQGPAGTSHQGTRRWGDLASALQSISARNNEPRNWSKVLQSKSESFLDESERNDDTKHDDEDEASFLDDESIIFQDGTEDKGEAEVSEANQVTPPVSEPPAPPVSQAEHPIGPPAEEDAQVVALKKAVRQLATALEKQVFESQKWRKMYRDVVIASTGCLASSSSPAENSFPCVSDEAMKEGRDNESKTTDNAHLGKSSFSRPPLAGFLSALSSKKASLEDDDDSVVTLDIGSTTSVPACVDDVIHPPETCASDHGEDSDTDSVATDDGVADQENTDNVLTSSPHSVTQLSGMRDSSEGVDFGAKTGTEISPNGGSEDLRPDSESNRMRFLLSQVQAASTPSGSETEHSLQLQVADVSVRLATCQAKLDIVGDQLLQAQRECFRLRTLREKDMASIFDLQSQLNQKLSQTRDEAGDESSVSQSRKHRLTVSVVDRKGQIRSDVSPGRASHLASAKYRALFNPSRLTHDSSEQKDEAEPYHYNTASVRSCEIILHQSPETKPKSGSSTVPTSGAVAHTIEQAVADALATAAARKNQKSPSKRHLMGPFRLARRSPSPRLRTSGKFPQAPSAGDIDTSMVPNIPEPMPSSEGKPSAKWKKLFNGPGAAGRSDKTIVPTRKLIDSQGIGLVEAASRRKSNFVGRSAASEKIDPAERTDRTSDYSGSSDDGIEDDLTVWTGNHSGPTRRLTKPCSDHRGNSLRPGGTRSSTERLEV